MKRGIIGIGIFALIAVVTVIVVVSGGGHKDTITVTGYIGGEKKGFFQDQEIADLLADKYGIVVDYTKAGSVEMVRYDDLQGQDFLFPSSQMAAEIFSREQGDKLLKSEKVFNSPIVIYSWKEVADSLIQEGMVEKRGDTYYVVGFESLVQAIEGERTWEDMGLNLYGKMNIICTDPNRSNSGNMYLGLLANILNNKEVVEPEDVLDVGSKAKAILDPLGLMEDSSGDLFSGYIEKGMGNSPLIVGYENQLIEFALDNPEIWDAVKDRVAILYPEPTVWAEHTVIALSDDCKRLIEALQDETIQALAWEKHGFRTGMMTTEKDMAILSTVGIPESIDLVMPMPNADVMEALMKAIE